MVSGSICLRKGSALLASLVSSADARRIELYEHTLAGARWLSKILEPKSTPSASDGVVKVRIYKRARE